MSSSCFWSRRVLELACTLEIEQTHDYFHAHVELDGDIAINPGDRVLVHGAPVQVRFGEKLVERRRATLERATWLDRAWTRLAARFQLQELYEVSFTPNRTL
jgi:hypothetical protein